MPYNKRYGGTTGLFPQPMDKILAQVTAPVMQKHGYLKARLFTQWAEIVGEETAKKCRPKQLTFPQKQNVQGALTLRVEKGFALEIQHLEPILLEKMAVYFGFRAIDRIRLEQA
jgi:hypothetical protein